MYNTEQLFVDLRSVCGFWGKILFVLKDVNIINNSLIISKRRIINCKIIDYILLYFHQFSAYLEAKLNF